MTASLDQGTLSDAQRDRAQRYLPAAEAMARRIGRRSSYLCQSLDLDDLAGVAREALVVAAARYDPDTGAPFWAYARPRVTGAILDALRRDNRSVRQHRRALAQLENHQRALDALTETAAEALRRDAKARVEAAAKVVQATAAGIIARRMALYDDQTVAAAEEDPETHLARTELVDRLRRVLATLSDDDQALYQAVYVEGRSLSDLARSEGVHPSTFSRRHARLLERLGEALTKPPAPASGSTRR